MLRLLKLYSRVNENRINQSMNALPIKPHTNFGGFALAKIDSLLQHYDLHVARMCMPRTKACHCVCRPWYSNDLLNSETWIFCDAALKTYSFFLYSYTHDLTLERCRPECL